MRLLVVAGRVDADLDAEGLDERVGPTAHLCSVLDAFALQPRV